jgi:hypothetical protein
MSARARKDAVDPASLGALKESAALIGQIAQNGWLAFGAAVLVGLFFFRKWRLAEEKVYVLLEKNNDLAATQKLLAEQQTQLASRVTVVMERLEAKAERRR